jgi:DNA polymerase III epsilon subunit-like protein
MIGENLLRFNRKQKYLSLDCETSSLNLQARNNLPWEYGWTLFTLDGVIEEKEYHVKWPQLKTGEMKIRKLVDDMTGFSRKFENYDSWTDPETVLNEFEKHLYNPEIIPIAHNGLGFDVYMHNTHRKVLGRPSDYSYIERFIDTNAVAKGWKLGYNWEGKNRIAAQYQLLDHRVRGMKTSIKALCKEFGIEYDIARAHHATYDVSLMNQIFRKLINLTEI